MNFLAETRHDTMRVVNTTLVGMRKKERKPQGVQTIGSTTLQLWSKLSREVQDELFETAVPLDPVIRNRLVA
jgi:hypothetical protein